MENFLKRGYLLEFTVISFAQISNINFHLDALLEKLNLK
jgi:hypothetical protein